MTPRYVHDRDWLSLKNLEDNCHFTYRTFKSIQGLGCVNLSKFKSLLNFSCLSTDLDKQQQQQQQQKYKGF